MVECTRCGCRNDSESRFCAACGFSLLAPRISRATPASGFVPNPPAVWQAPPGPFAQSASAPMASTPEAEWNLVQKRAALAPVMGGYPSPILDNAGSHPQNFPVAQPRSATPPVGQTEPPRNLPAVLMGFLVSYDGTDLGRFWPLYQGRLVVGRAQAAEGLDIAIDHGATSARHAQLVAAATPSRLSVQDLGSTNGTFINDQRLAAGHSQMVAHGDQIRFGGFTARVVLVL